MCRFVLCKRMAVCVSLSGSSCSAPSAFGLTVASKQILDMASATSSRKPLKSSRRRGCHARRCRSRRGDTWSSQIRLRYHRAFVFIHLIVTRSRRVINAAVSLFVILFHLMSDPSTKTQKPWKCGAFQHLCMGRSECRLKFETGIELHEIQRHVISIGSAVLLLCFQRALAPSTCMRLCWSRPPPSSQPLSHCDIPSLLQHGGNRARPWPPCTGLVVLCKCLQM